jgi:2-(1,2-epoxy-1,2-dihydrophenyl)acetyl-CoA isomerase
MGNEGISVELDSQTGVATIEFWRPPHNYFDSSLIEGLAASYAELESDSHCRAIVLASAGKNFCAGADLEGVGLSAEDAAELYDHAARMFANGLPVVAAVQGRAIGGGLGVALSADFRVASEETRFVCNFARLGLHHGFGITVTLPAVVGQQRALELLYTGGEVRGEQALTMGLCDRIAPTTSTLRTTARELAVAIAGSAPLAVRSIRQTMRGRLPELVREATRVEHAEQSWLLQTDDFQEGVRAAVERRSPVFAGR